MYSKTEQKFITVFDPKVNEKTGKTVFSRISEAIKVGEKDGKNEYEFDSWNAVFCGKCLEKAKKLKNKEKINILEWNVRNHYVAADKRSYPKIMIYDFEKVGEGSISVETGYRENEDGFLEMNTDKYEGEMPFN